MSKDKPLTSVLITTYKRPDYLDKCLSSVLSQDFKDLLHMISDVPPFVYLKTFLKGKCPTFWRAATCVYMGIFQGMRWVLSLTHA